MNYQHCTVEELAEHFKTKTTQAVTQQLMYYQKKESTEIVAKIKRARILAKQKRLSAEMESISVL